MFSLRKNDREAKRERDAILSTYNAVRARLAEAYALLREAPPGPATNAVCLRLKLVDKELAAILAEARARGVTAW